MWFLLLKDEGVRVLDHLAIEEIGQQACGFLQQALIGRLAKLHLFALCWGWGRLG
jgi:hypothetical protein